MIVKPKYRWILVCFLLLNVSLLLDAKNHISESKKNVDAVSWVDTSLEGTQKYVLRVDGTPYYMINIQIRLDLLRYSEKWSDAACEALVAQAAADGFNTVSIPVHWYEVEPEKDNFDWKILDEYLTLVNKYGLKMEMLWFGANSGGHVQWLSRSKEMPNHLRTPDYVLYSPAPDSKETTSDYRIRRDMSDYSMDMTDDRLCTRETYVLGVVMKHISEWDKANGNKHPIIGVQINNEAIGQKGLFANSEVISYLSKVASAVKQSDYVVWTRANCVYWNVMARVHGNEERRISKEGTNLDFMGIDTYRHHFSSDTSFVASMRYNMPYVGKNFRMIMETNTNVPYAAQMHLAALSGNSAFDFYSIESLYGRDGDMVKPLVAYLEDIRLVNKILSSDRIDLATNTHGYGLFVHNWEGGNSTPSVSNAGIVFEPNYPTSQGISILRSNTELVLMSSKGGRFTLPDGIDVLSASKGYFDDNNCWVNEGEVLLSSSVLFDASPSTNRSLSVEAGTTVRLVCKDLGLTIPYVIYQAENAILCAGTKSDAAIEGVGFAGNGYAQLPSSEGACIIWKRVDGKAGGNKTLKIRYSNGSGKVVKCLLLVNGKMQVIQLEDTGSWTNYCTVETMVTLNAAMDNLIKLESTGNYKRVNRVVYPLSAGNIDELQLF